MQRARQEVPKIPGIKMTIEEQEEEIKEWEDKIVRQREELAKFKALARKVFEGMDGKADTEMGGMAES